jgi:hypothetical protein
MSEGRKQMPEFGIRNSEGGKWNVILGARHRVQGEIRMLSEFTYNPEPCLKP